MNHKLPMRTVLVPLPIGVKSFIMEDEEGEPTCYLNSKYNFETNISSYIHEAAHDENDDLHREIDVDQVEAERHKK